MEVLQDYTFAGSSRAIEPKYDWETLTNGNTYRMVKGQDYTCTTDAFRSSLYGQRKRRGLKLNINSANDNEIVFQFYGHGQAKPAKSVAKSSSRLMSAVDAAAALGLQAQTLIDLARCGLVPSEKLNQRFKFSVKEVKQKLGMQ